MLMIKLNRVSMRKWLFFILGVLIIQSSFSQGNIIWPESDEELITNTNATIAIQASNFPNITLEGYENIPSGVDIGVFYGNDEQSYNCGGFTQWPDNDENFVIPAFGDDPFTFETDGFVSGQPYTWFLRINNSDDPFDGWTDYVGENLVMDSSDSFQENWDDYNIVTEKKPSGDEIEDLKFANKVCSLVKSNAIVLVKDHHVIGIGAGQPNRLNSVKIACDLAGNSSQGAVLASDAFFPFADGLEVAIKSGIKAVIQPGGSIRDNEVISEANKAGISMVMTGRRHFLH